MNQQNFHCSICANVSIKDAFDGVSKRVPEWWTENFEGSSENLNNIFTVRFGETFGTYKIVEVISDKKILWFTIDCNLHLLKNKKEWKDTKMLWEFSTKNNLTEIKFTHIGLVPELECFTDCSGGWNHYVGKSLYKLLTEQKGMPDDENYSAKYKQ